MKTIMQLALPVALLTLSASRSVCQVTMEDLRLIPAGADDFAESGSSVDICGSTIVLGAPQDNLVGFGGTGAVYLFDAETGVQIRRLLPPNPEESDYFGASVAIGDGLVAVGAPGDDSNGYNSGAAFLFDVESGAFIDVLHNADAEPKDGFGDTVAIDAGLLAVGAFGPQTVSLYDTQTRALLRTIPAPSLGAGFGQAVDIDDGVLIVGAPSHSAGGHFAGRAYLYDANTGALLHTLNASDPSPSAYFGSAVSLHRGYAVVGARRYNADSIDNGAAYLFDVATGAQLHRLVPGGNVEGAQFAHAVLVRDGLVVVGAPQENRAEYASGAAYLFDADTGALLSDLLPSDGTQNLRFGFDIAMTNQTLVVGAPQIDSPSASGRGYLFQLPDTDTDMDGLPDRWERFGVDANGDNITDLAIHEPPYEADPLVKDIFVELDLMTGAIGPRSGFETMLVDAFANAPIDNGAGVNLHIEMSDLNLPFVTLPTRFASRDGDLNDFTDLYDEYYGTSDERDDPNWDHIRAARLGVFRYCLWSADVDDPLQVLGHGELPGDDFALYDTNLTPSARAQAGAFMHELGHTLGLGHGGTSAPGVADHANFKPHYFGVMNYSWAEPRSDLPDHAQRWRLDYNRETLPDLDETDLNENDPLVPTEPNPGIMYSNPTRWGLFDFLIGNNRRIVSQYLPAPSGVDWDGDGVHESSVSVDLNWLPTIHGTKPEQNILRSRNDWSAIAATLADRSHPNFKDGVHNADLLLEVISREALDEWASAPVIGCSVVDLSQPFGVLNFTDVLAFLSDFVDAAPGADLAEPIGVHDYSDILTFLGLFGAGCP
ncbi:MAG: GC-type dockerin domain-anchored protein [Phycisphaerales bacterium JB059]